MTAGHDSMQGHAYKAKPSRSRPVCKGMTTMKGCLFDSDYRFDMTTGPDSDYRFDNDYSHTVTPRLTVTTALDKLKKFVKNKITHCCCNIQCYNLF